MSDTLDAVRPWLASGGRVAMATLVATRGATPRRAGAKMWVGEDGRVLGSVTIGGCVDARVVAESEGVLAEGRARTIALHLGADEALELGLTCGGTIELLVEPLRLAADDPVVALYEHVGAHVRRGGRAAIATIPGAAPRRIALLDDGGVAGTLGDAALDAALRARAADLLAGESGVVVLGEGDAIPVAVEVHAPAGALVVVGAGHVAMALSRLAAPLGLRTVIVDARERWASAERFPDADERLVGIPSELVGAMPLGAADAVVLVAHDYKFDLPVLRVVLATAAGYVGLLGSRRRGAAILSELREAGIAEERLARVRVPAGLDIGARTTEEIALSILAEAIAAVRGRSGGSLRADIA
ncbi:MAG TPA: XdhC family protein [Gemmatimonadaceae bacterium]